MAGQRGGFVIRCRLARAVSERKTKSACGEGVSIPSLDDENWVALGFGLGVLSSSLMDSRAAFELDAILGLFQWKRKQAQ